MNLLRMNSGLQGEGDLSAVIPVKGDLFIFHINGIIPGFDPLIPLQIPDRFNIGFFLVELHPDI